MRRTMLYDGADELMLPSDFDAYGASGTTKTALTCLPARVPVLHDGSKGLSSNRA